jgi:hypothetical protein
MINNNRDRTLNFAFRVMMRTIIALEELVPGRIDRRVARFGIQAGQIVVDSECGPGRFTTRFPKRVDPRGKLYAVDVQELTIEQVKK